MADGDDEKPVLVSRRDVRKFIDSFRAEPRFKEVGMTVLVDHSGRLFTKRKCTIKDIISNKEVVLSVVKAMEGHSRVSAYVIQDALLSFYTEAKLYPSGVYREIPAVQDWALKYGVAIRKLVSRLRRLMVRSSTSKHRKLTEIKRIARDYGWGKVKSNLDTEVSDSESSDPEAPELGDPDGLEELDDNSSTTTPPGSSVSLASGSSADTKLERVIEQLREVKLRWETTTPVMAPCQKNSGDCVDLVSSDEERPTVGDPPVPLVEGKKPAPVPSVDHKETAAQGLANYLRQQKMKKLAEKLALNDGEPSSVTKKEMPSEKNPYVLPAHVVDTMKQLSTPPTAFSLRSQYVREVSNARAAAGAEPASDGDDPDGVSSAPARRKRPKPPKRKHADKKVKVAKTKAKDGNENPWRYNETRMAFITNVRMREGFNFDEAKKAWDESDEKYNFLGSVSVSELKRRKFIAKGVSENPWAKCPADS